MNKAEEYYNLTKDIKSTLFDRFYYHYLMRKCRKYAKRGYTGKEFSKLLFSPYINSKLKAEGFKLIEDDEVVTVYWSKDEDEKENG